jgi:hypothetical protein
MIIVISTGTLASSVVIAVQKRGRLGERLSLHAIRITKIFSYLSITDIPLHLRPGTRACFVSSDNNRILGVYGSSSPTRSL